MGELSGSCPKIGGFWVFLRSQVGLFWVLVSGSGCLCPGHKPGQCVALTQSHNRYHITHFRLHYTPGCFVTHFCPDHTIVVVWLTFVWVTNLVIGVVGYRSGPQIPLKYPHSGPPKKTSEYHNSGQKPRKSPPIPPTPR